MYLKGLTTYGWPLILGLLGDENSSKETLVDNSGLQTDNSQA